MASSHAERRQDIDVNILFRINAMRSATPRMSIVSMEKLVHKNEKDHEARVDVTFVPYTLRVPFDASLLVSTI